LSTPHAVERIIYLLRPYPGPRSFPIVGRTAPSPLFGLAPDGVYRAALLARGAVGSYPTFSPLPRRTGAVCFLWHCPSTVPSETAAYVYPWRNRGYAASRPVVFGLSSPVIKTKAILHPSKVALA